MEFEVTIKVKIENDQGYDQSDIQNEFYGEGRFAESVKKFISKNTYGEIPTSDIEVTVE